MEHIKKVLFFILVMVITGMAQITIGVQVGYSKSDFEEHEAVSGAIPLGITVGTTIIPALEFGGEVNTLISPFVFEEQYVTDDFKVNQTIIGIYGKYFVPLQVVNPYARLGLGYYLGGWEQGSYNGDYDGAVGFSLGVGANTMFGVYGEFVYHIVSRKGDWAGAESMGANNWGIHVGYTFNLLDFM